VQVRVMSRGWLSGLSALMAMLAACQAWADDAAPLRFDVATNLRDFCSLAQDAFAREDFAVLESTARRARALKNRFPGSKTELQVFYEAFAKDSCSQTYIYMSEDVGKARVTLAEHWLAQKPDSSTAKIASAMIWNQFAWAGRGRGYANEVSNEQWAIFGERMKRAAEFIRAVDPDQDAQAYGVLLNLARDFQVPRAQLDAIYQHAYRRFPDYFAYYADYATILLPKWFGQPGEIVGYLKSLLTDPGGDIGVMAYARAAERLSFDMHSPDIYRDTGLNWEDLRRGFKLRATRDGLDKHAWISFCYYAVMAGDRPTARDAYGEIVDIDEWPVGGLEQFSREVLPWITQGD
jgi:hypothetical protein